jgi:hypothetical protein
VSDAPEAREPSVLERHAQTLIGVVVASLVLWIGVTIQQQSVSLAEMRVEITNLRSQLASYSTQTADRYTSARAAQDFAARDREYADLRDRVRSLEQVHRQQAPQ